MAWAAITVAVPLLIAAALLLIGGREATLQWLLERAVQASQGRLTLAGVHGTLYRGATVGMFEWREPGGITVQVHDAQLQWRLPALLERTLALTRISAARVEVTPAASSGAPALPATLALPVAILIDQAEIGSLRVAGTPVELSDVRLAGAYAGGAFRVVRFSAKAPWGDLQLAGELRDSPPFALQARGGLNAKLDAIADPVTAMVTLGGNLSAIDAEVDGTLAQAQLRARSRVAPWAANPVERIDFEGASIDPKRLAVLSPSMKLTVRGHLVPQWPPARSPPASQTNPLQAIELRGHIDALNEDPGTLDADRVPVTAAAGDFQIHGTLLELTGLQAMILGDGQLGGQASIRLEGPPEAGAGAVVSSKQVLSGLGLELKVVNLNLSRVFQGLLPTALSGQVRAAANGVSVDLKEAGKVLAVDTSLRGLLNWDADTIRIDQGEVRAKGGLLLAQGSIGTSGQQAFDLKGRAEHVEPHNWLAVPALPDGSPLRGVFNGTWEARGKLAPLPSAAIRLNLQDSVLNGLPVSGDITAALTATRSTGWPIDRIHGVDLQIAIGGSRIKASGALGQSGDRLAVRLSANSLTELDRRLEGRLAVEGELSGSLSMPAVRADFKGTELRWRDGYPVSAQSLQGRLAVADFKQGRLELAADVAGLKAGDLLVERGAAGASGTLASHQYTVQASGAGLNLKAAGVGHLDLEPGRPPRWATELASLESSGALDAKLLRPATVALQAGSVTLESVEVAVAGGRLSIAAARVDGGRMSANGEIDRLAIDEVVAGIRKLRLDPGELDAVPETQLRMQGTFDVNGTSLDDLTGLVSMQAQTPLIDGVSRARIELNNGALGGSLQLRLPTLRFARRLVGNQWRIDGRLAFDGTPAGTLRSPRLAGTLTGSGLRLEQHLLGWRFEDGVLTARFEGDRLNVERLRFNSARGYLELSGALRLPEVIEAQQPAGADGAAARRPAALRALNLGEGNFALKAERLPLAIGPGQRVVLSGDTEILIRRDTVRWQGKLRTDEGFIELRDLDSPADPPDLVIEDRRAKSATRAPDTGAAGAVSGIGVKLEAALDLDLGKNFRVSGNGVSARLGGEISLAGTLPDAPRATGTVRVIEGTYSAYGQQLQIERGVLIFNGPFDDPVIDVVALRKFLPVEAGVSLSGTAKSPRVRLVSKPEVPDAEKLSWLVLGVGLEDAAASGQGAALQVAAASLFSSGDSAFSGGVARALGLDVLGVRGASTTTYSSALTDSLTLPGAAASSATTSTAQQNVVTVGKRLSSRLFVSYEQGVRGVWNLLRIQYDISNRLSVRAQTGSESALDLLYFYAFD